MSTHVDAVQQAQEERMGKIVGVAVVMAALATGCTSYNPRPSARVAETTFNFTREGRTYTKVLGIGLPDAVQGVPEAEKYARAYRSKSIAGFTLGVVGIALVGGGSALTTSDQSTDPFTGLPVTSTANYVGYGFLGLGTALVLTGLIIEAVADSDRLDAINAYNDGASKEKAPEPAKK